MKPKRIILVRHGESQGNVDKSIYKHIPDYAIYLTENGINQAKEVGQKLKEILGNESYCVYFSPYFRARQTMDNALDVLKPLNLEFFREEPRIREQEYSGSLRKVMDDNEFEKEREKFGKFFYRMDGGESGADVYDRISDFIGTLHRDFQKENYPDNVLIFGHGMGNRLFLMRWFHTPVGVFETWKNPKNGALFIMERKDNLSFDNKIIDSKYKLITEIEQHPKGYGYKYKDEHWK